MTSVDLVVGLVILCLASAGLYGCGVWVGRRAPGWVSAITGALTLMLTLWFAVGLYGRLTLAQFLPFSNAIIVGNWILPGAALLMGLVSTGKTIPPWRRTVLTGLLLVPAGYAAVYDLVAPAPPAQPPRFFHGFSVQTTPASCSVCCAVALLMEYELSATEAEMMKLCLTRKNGTPELGLYRGLKIKTRGTPWQVEILRCDVEQLRQSFLGPALLLVDTYSVPPGSAGRWWRPRRTDHAIVVYGFADNQFVEIGDPSMGRTRWQLEELVRRWHGQGLRLVRRAEGGEE